MKKILALVLALATVLSLSAVAFAATNPGDFFDYAYDSDGEKTTDVPNPLKWEGTFDLKNSATIILDPAIPASTFYIPLGSMTRTFTSGVEMEDLVNSDYFKFDVDKKDNGKLISKISVETDKTLGGTFERSAFLKVTLNDTMDTDENKTSGTITFKAKNDNTYYASKSDKPVSGTGSTIWEKDDKFTLKYTLWVSNVKVGNDDNPDVGDRVYMDPDKNDTNTLVWGDDRAALKFEADDDARKFYCRLSTSNMSDIYAEYGDPVDADLWFYDFVGHPTVPATSKATLTLGIPWDDDDDYTPDPENCFIYELDADGYLTDVTSKFTYSEDDEEIPGWSIRTRQLGTYIVSDTELDVTVDEPETSEPADVETPTNNGKDIPNTGSSDMVNVALVAAVVSLAAAGAVAFRKVK